jgi:hypothetical protein
LEKKEGVDLKMNKKTVFTNEEKELGQTLYYFALVFKGPIKTFEAIRDYLLKFSDAELIFQTKSIQYLWIIKAQENKSFQEFIKERGVETT